MSSNSRFTLNEQDVVPASGKRTPVASWGEVALGVLPYLLILLGGGLPMLLVGTGLLAWESAAMRIINTGLIVLLIACLLAVFILAWRRRWPVWSATWYPFFCISLLLLVVGLSSLLARGRFDVTINQEAVMYIWFPLIVAVLLYAVARLDPLRALLAALPVIYLLWLPNLEFVPDDIELVIQVSGAVLVCLAIAFVLRRGDWRTGLYALLVTNLLVGALYAWVGIYHGGTLPFTAPGPNLVEVLRSLVPQYLATCAILLGPLFAWRFRQMGRFAGRGGKIAYHLVLAGLLLVIMANLAGLMVTMQVDSPDSSAGDPMLPLVILGLGVYLVGIVWLYWYTPFPTTATRWADRILLPLLPLGIPLMFMLPFITWRWPVSNLYGIPLLWVLPHAVSLSLGMMWLVLSVWVVTSAGGSSRLVAAYQAVPDAHILSH